MDLDRLLKLSKITAYTTLTVVLAILGVLLCVAVGTVVLDGIAHLIGGGAVGD